MTFNDILKKHKDVTIFTVDLRRTGGISDDGVSIDYHVDNNSINCSSSLSMEYEDGLVIINEILKRTIIKMDNKLVDNNKSISSGERNKAELKSMENELQKVEEILSSVKAELKTQIGEVEKHPVKSAIKVAAALWVAKKIWKYFKNK